MKTWSKIDEDTLKRLYPDPNWTFNEIVELFPEHSPGAIRSKAQYMGVERPLLYSSSQCPLCGQELPKKETQP